MTDSTHFLYTAAEIRAHEAALFAAGHSPVALMAAAGAAAFSALQQHWPSARRVGVLLGSGQNAGDGLVLARQAYEAGFGVTVFGWWQSDRLTGAAATMAAMWLALPGAGAALLREPAELAAADFDVVVDAGFGIGFDPSRGASPEVAAWIEAVNACRLRGAAVMALDLPSGLCADTGRGSPIVTADLTICFLGLKIGLFAGQGAAVRGRLLLALLGTTPPPSAVRLITAVPALSPKPRAGHKGSFGTVLVLAGNRGMAGAARMAAEAALRSGAGKVIVATHPAHAVVLGVGCPELIIQGVDSPAAVLPWLAMAQAVVLGCGLGTDDWAQGMIDAVWDAAVPMVVDADALRAVATRPARSAPTVLTPHPGEAARLLDCRVADIETDRLATARTLQARYASLVLLKGAGSVLCTPAGLSVCGRGDPALATAGSGDVLAGVIGGLLALGLAPEDALSRAVCWHALAGEAVAAEGGSWGAVATDLLPRIRALMNGRALAVSDAALRVWP